MFEPRNVVMHLIKSNLSIIYNTMKMVKIAAIDKTLIRELPDDVLVN